MTASNILNGTISPQSRKPHPSQVQVWVAKLREHTVRTELATSVYANNLVVNFGGVQLKFSYLRYE